MDTTPYKIIELENGHTLSILDVSRKIGADAFVVRVKAVIEYKIESELFSHPLPPGVSIEDIRNVLGETTLYEYEVERNFIMAHEKDAVFESLVGTFLKNLGQYVAKPNFPEKFVIKAYNDRIK